jgi:hypothetical protein
LGGLLLCLRVITVNPALITSDNPGQEGCIVGGDLTKLLSDVNTLLLLISCQESHHGLSKKYPTKFFPTVNNGERVGKLSMVVEGTFMRMPDFLLPRNIAECVCHCQIVKWCNVFVVFSFRSR